MSGTSAKLSLVFLFAIWALMAGAQDSPATKKKGRTYHVTGRVMEAFEGTPMSDVAVEVMNEDSVVLAKVTTQKADSEEGLGALFKGVFNVDLPALGKYIAKYSYVGYETKYVPFQLKYRRETQVRLDDVLLQKDIVMLDEVTVKATKVKMVLHGDTIVYNADAFHLAEGSMLDALIKKLPGAELSSDGRITINGKQVETLLVNGKDFFTGDPKLALQNLPAYTVNKIKVYDQRGAKSELMGKDMNDKNFVMDVRLKKEYSSGWIGYAEGGYGTENRYHGKLAAMHFNDVSRQLVYGSSNNLGQNSVYNADFGSWTGSGTPTSDSQYHNAGFAYQHQTKEGMKSDRFASSNDISYSDVDTKDWSSTQNFLEGGDTFGRTSAISGNKSLRINSENKLTRWMSNGVAEVSLTASYTKNDAEQQSYSAMFNADPTGFRDLQQDVFGAENRFEAISLNRSKSISESSKNSFSVKGNSNFFITVFGDLVRANVSASYENLTGSSFALNNYDYFQTGTTDRRNNYNDTPSHNFNIEGTAAYAYSLFEDTSISLDYTYNHQYNRTNNLLYRLDCIEGRSEDTPYNVLPSTAAALNAVLDSPNSYTYGQHNITNTLAPGFIKNITVKENAFLMVVARVPFELKTNSLNYFREQHYAVEQHRLNVNPTLSVSYNHDTFSWHVGGDYTSSQPGMTNLITFRDDSNPLYVSLGNAHLKDTHNLHTYFDIDNMGTKTGYRFNVEYTRTYNALATSTVYDKSTGITTSQPTNINGNWNANGMLELYHYFDKDSHFKVSNSANATYMRSVDLNSVAGSTAGGQSVVNNVNLSERLSIDWEITEKISLKLYASENFTHQASRREGFTTVNAHNIGYGCEVTAELPWHLQFSSTLDQTSRRGYSDSQMNTNELVWNAKLQRSFIKGALLASVEGYDILGQRSNRSYVLNAQGRTESYSNLIPSFGMITLAYRFVKTPKNKKVEVPGHFSMPGR